MIGGENTEKLDETYVCTEAVEQNKIWYKVRGSSAGPNLTVFQTVSTFFLFSGAAHLKS